MWRRESKDSMEGEKGENYTIFLFFNKMRNFLWNDVTNFLKRPHLTNSIFEVMPISWFSTSCTSIDPIHCRDPTNVAGLSPASTRAFVYLKTQTNAHTRQLLKTTFRTFSLITSMFFFPFKTEISPYHEVIIIINSICRANEM